MKSRLVLICLAALCLLAGCAPGTGYERQVGNITRPYNFSIVRWELGSLAAALQPWGNNSASNDPAAAVTAYLVLMASINALEAKMAAAVATGDAGTEALAAELNRLRAQRAELAPAVEDHLAAQIGAALAEEGIYHPADEHIKLKVTFPPLEFKLVTMPLLLVISPRDRIESLREITLLPGLSLAEMEGIEADVDRLGYSSLVTRIGGLGATLPTLVAHSSSLEYIIITATEEWLHQYLALKPLGFRYFLDVTGIAPDYDIATINEGVADIVSREISALVLARHYPNLVVPEAKPEAEDTTVFDFNREMREIRKAVDAYLANGEISQAEAYMEAKRLYLAAQGYYLRKLNQAYFAFHGTYATSPTSISPIGTELQRLREQSASLKNFLNAVASLTSREGLAASLR